MSFSLPDLPYPHDALAPYMSRETLEYHHDKHHAAYVTGANTTLEKLHDARQKEDFGTINQLEKSLAFHISGHKLHSILWSNMSPSGGGDPTGDAKSQIEADFGQDQQPFAQRVLLEIANPGVAVGDRDHVPRVVDAFPGNERLESRCEQVDDEVGLLDLRGE